MSGEFGLAGYRFQYHVIVLTAPELWCGSDDHGVESIVIEGCPGAEKVDYELVGRLSTDDAVVQVKSRWSPKAWSPTELLDLLMSLERDSGGPAAAGARRERDFQLQGAAVLAFVLAEVLCGLAVSGLRVPQLHKL